MSVNGLEAVNQILRQHCALFLPRRMWLPGSQARFSVPATRVARRDSPINQSPWATKLRAASRARPRPWAPKRRLPACQNKSLQSHQRLQSIPAERSSSACMPKVLLSKASRVSTDAPHFSLPSRYWPGSRTVGVTAGEGSLDAGERLVMTGGEG
jgi:hypothetical protein